jgi:hypothetical protein
MPTPTILTPKELHKFLICNPVAGTMTWRARTPEMFSHCERPEHACAAWNARYAGKEAFTTDHNEGYRVGKIFGRTYRAHRVIWAMTTGAWPEDQIDHINGDPADNRIENLRAVTQSENLRNAALPRNNTSGAMGVGWHKPAGKWQAQIRGNGKQINLGLFTNKDDAIAARAAAEKKYGFHENHGRAPCQS